MTTTEVLVPIKAFADAKQRLLVEPHQRIWLMKRMASTVLVSSDALTTWVVCDDHEVAAWAAEAGASVLFQHGSGLNDTVQRAMERRRNDGVKRVIVAHGDLPLVSNLERFAGVDGVLAIPDLAGSGTKILSVPTTSGFKFAYGPSSAASHKAEAKRCGLTFETVRDDNAGFDVNTIADLRKLEQQHPETFRQLTNKLDIFGHQYQPVQGPSS